MGWTGRVTCRGKREMNAEFGWENIQEKRDLEARDVRGG